MRLTRPLAVLVAALALAFPAHALAQGNCKSASDCQYGDPFGNTTPSKPKPKPKPTTPSAPVTTTPSQPVTSTPTSSTTSSPSSSSSTSSSTSTNGTSKAKGQLPRTGLDLRELGGIGLLLMCAGLLARRRWA